VISIEPLFKLLLLVVKEMANSNISPGGRSPSKKTVSGVPEAYVIDGAAPYPILPKKLLKTSPFKLITTYPSSRGTTPLLTILTVNWLVS
jgi:hypothetical protein